MKAQEIKARLVLLANRLNDSMDDKDVAHRLRLLAPGIKQLEAAVDGLESKVKAVADHRANPPPSCEPDQVPTKRRARAAKH